MSSLTRSDFLKIMTGGTLGALFLNSCDNVLQEHPYSQLAPGNLFKSVEGVRSVLAAAYGNADVTNRRIINDLSEWVTGISWQTGGGEHRTAVPMINYTWDASYGLFNGYYNTCYRAIRGANTLLDNLDAATIPESKKKQFKAEARFVRAFSYTLLRNKFGPTPLRTSTKQLLALPRANKKDMRDFIESEFLDIIPLLPDPGQALAYGRATNGAARGILCKFYLNTKQWSKVVDVSHDIINMKYYELFPRFIDMLKVKNEGNKEMIWINTCDTSGTGNGNLMMNGVFPPAFEYWPRTGLRMQPNWNNWASSYRLRDNFYHSFNPKDKRRKPILTKYINKKGETVDLLKDFKDDTRSFRYWPDPNAQGNAHGNDEPVVRYADILLSRAEALNELQGPNQESIDLVNQVRGRAGLDDLLLSNFATKESLRNHIVLKERNWEFYNEGKRREDLIRMGKLIKFAHDRGITNAESYRVLYPLPQPAIDANPKLKQNPGY